MMTPTPSKITSVTSLPTRQPVGQSGQSWNSQPVSGASVAAGDMLYWDDNAIWDDRKRWNETGPNALTAWDDSFVWDDNLVWTETLQS